MLARSATAAVAVLGLFACAASAQDFGEKTLRLGDVPMSADKTFRLGDAPAAGLDNDPADDVELISRFCGYRGCGYRACGYRGCGFYGGYRACYSYAAGFCGLGRGCYSRPYYYGAACYSPVYYSTPAYYYSTPAYYYSTPAYYYYRPAYSSPISIEIGGTSLGGSAGTYSRNVERVQSRPMPFADDGIYPYNGGPSSPVPLPQSSPPPPPLPKDELPGGGRVVSLPSQPTKFAYPAYGEQTVPTGFAVQRGLLIDTDPVKTVRK